MSVGRIVISAGVGLLVCAPAAGQELPPTRPTGPVATCVTFECHGDVLSGKVLHRPAAYKKCDACHTLTHAGGHLFELTVPEHQLCLSCHVQTHRTVVHRPVADGECTGCHDPHSSDHRFLLVEDPAGGLCLQCHPAEEFGSKKYVHGPVADAACIVCHEAHSSWNWKLLAKKPQELCVLCHQDVVARLEVARHPHEPAVAGRCDTCHDPHASDHPAQLRAGVPQLCFSCHEHAAIQRLVESSPRVHGVINSEESCTACHTGHGSSIPKLLARPLLSLCLSCHDEPVETPEGRRLTNMGTLLRDNPNHHGPIRRADCSACHNPHASSNFSLLTKEYPQEFYAPFDLKNYQLCFTCHLKEMVAIENGVGVTGFRDGSRNLHFVHVNKEKGRTCRACHEVHASKRPFHICEKVPFGAGGWEIEINFEQLPDGGRCAPGCHEVQTYSRAAQRAPSTNRAGSKAGENE